MAGFVRRPNEMLAVYRDSLRGTPTPLRRRLARFMPGYRSSSPLQPVAEGPAAPGVISSDPLELAPASQYDLSDSFITTSEGLSRPTPEHAVSLLVDCMLRK